MIAEIKKKAPKEHNGKEDLLTGNFFGAIRYTSSFGVVLGALLNHIDFESDQKKANFKKLLDSITQETFEDKIKLRFWDSFKWENGRREPDLLIEMEDVVILIEVKLNSGLSKDEQLEDYAVVLKRDFREKKDHFLIFLAQFPNSKKIFDNEKNKSALQELSGFGNLSWQAIARELEKLKGLEYLKSDYRDRKIIADLGEYLKAKGLDGFTDCFSPFRDKQYPDFEASIQFIKNEQNFMAEKEIRNSIPKAFELVVEVHDLSLKIMRAMDENCGDFIGHEVTDNKSNHNFMVWRSNGDKYGMSTGLFLKFYRNELYPNKLFIAGIDWTGAGYEEPQLIIAVYFFEEGLAPTSFGVNEAWRYHRPINISFTDFEREIIHGIEKTFKSTCKPEKSVINGFKSGQFQLKNLFDYHVGNLMEEIIKGFERLAN